MTPGSIAQMLSGVRSTLYGLSATNVSDWAKTLLNELPWDVHPSRKVEVLRRTESSKTLTSMAVEDVTCGMRLDQLGYALSGNHVKAVTFNWSGSHPVISWIGTSTSSPTDAFIRVMDNASDSGASELLGAFKLAAMFAASVGDVQQANLLEEITAMLGAGVTGFKKGSKSYPGIRHIPMDAMIPFV